jgi:hypothetical protein
VRRSEWRTFYSPESSNIGRVSYNEALQELEVRFNNGSSYRYQAVPIAIYELLRDAGSVGSTFGRLIKNVYQFEKVE